MANTSENELLGYESSMDTISQNVDLHTGLTLELDVLCQDSLKTAITDNVHYYSEYSSYYNKLSLIYVDKGPAEAHSFALEKQRLLPKKPDKVEFNILGVKKSPRKTLKNMKDRELLNELEKYVYSQEPEVLSIPEFNNDVMDVVKVQEVVKKYDKHINSKSLKDTVQYGLWLEKLKKMNYGRFNKFVVNNLSISLAWTKKLISVGSLFSNYKRLQKLNLPISIITIIIHKLDRALIDNSDLASSWKV